MKRNFSLLLLHDQCKICIFASKKSFWCTIGLRLSGARSNFNSFNWQLFLIWLAFHIVRSQKFVRKTKRAAFRLIFDWLSIRIEQIEDTWIKKQKRKKTIMVCEEKDACSSRQLWLSDRREREQRAVCLCALHMIMCRFNWNLLWSVQRLAFAHFNKNTYQFCN